MNHKKKVTCIVCPLGCKIVVTKKDNHVDIVSGNKCKKGLDYACTEVNDPRRMLTSLIRVHHGQWPLVSVKSTHPIPKNTVFKVLQEIKKSRVEAPVHAQQTLIKNVADTGSDIIATKTIHRTTQKKKKK